MAPPSFKPTEKQRAEVRILAAAGVPEEDVAQLLGITKPTLRKHFKDDLSAGAVRASAEVKKRLYREAMKGNVACMIFWLKARAGWSDKGVVAEPGKKEQKQDAASKAVSGKFAPARPPLKLVK